MPTNVHAQSYTPVFYYHYGDHLGSSNVMTDRAGVLVQHYEYSAFGKETHQNNTSAFSLSNRYTGQVLDEETGLYYYNARYYDPELGRFVQADTIVPEAGSSQALNRYSYCVNNPLKYVDPSGHFGVEWVIAGVIIGAAIGGATAAATGENVGMGILTGAIGGLFAGLGGWAGSVWGAAASSSIGGSAGAAVGTGISFAGAVAGGATGGAIGAAITGGNIGMSALTGAIAGGIAFGIGQLSNAYLINGAVDTGAEELIQAGSTVAGGALGGGIGAELQGGSFGEGAAYGAVGAGIGFGIGYFLKQNNQPLDPKDHNVGHRAAQLLGKIWNLPNTIVGLAWGGLGKVIDWNGVGVSCQHNAVMFSHHPLQFFGSLTVGNAMFLDVGANDSYRGDLGPVWWHEIFHTLQGQQLGPLYLPSNILGQMTAGAIGIFTGYDYANQNFNWNERGPYQYKTWR